MPDHENEQERAWQQLYEQINQALLTFGTEGVRRTADFWIDDDNIGTRQHKIYVRNLDLLKPAVIDALKSLLDSYPAWELVVAVSIPGPGDAWPEMGLIIRKHEIVDGLQRQYFPEEFRSLIYPQSRPGTDRG